MMLTRRKMLVVASAGITAVATGLTGHGCDGGSKSEAPKARASLPTPSSGDLIVAEPGPLPSEDRETLRRVADQLAKRWKFPALEDETLKDLLILKSERAPSYLGEYHSAADLYRAASSRHGETAALDRLLNPNLKPESREGHAHRFVIVEMLHLIVIYGGFRVLGYENYPGHTAGEPFAYRQ